MSDMLNHTSQCVNDVKRALQNVQGIDSCDVDLSTKQVVVTGRGGF